MFVRIYRSQDRNSLLLNVNFITRIDVLDDGRPALQFWRTNFRLRQQPKRFYRVFLAGEAYDIVADNDGNCPVTKVFEDIYQNAVKG